MELLGVKQEPTVSLTPQGEIVTSLPELPTEKSSVWIQHTLSRNQSRKQTVPMS